MSSKAPFRVTVASIVSSRYGDLTIGRPESWDMRKEGVDVVQSSTGETIRLLSDGQQSVPQKGWVLLITDGDSTSGYRWTLFGMPEGVSVNP